jgi:DNA topoisomerase I
MMSKLLIVESPGKIKKLKSILGSGWDIQASFGHIRQLSKEGEGALGFEMGNGSIQCKYVPTSERSKKTIAQLKFAAQRASEVILASDPDREGETIAWHLAQELGLKNPKRVVYSEITDAAVKAAIARPRQLDLDMVSAGRCRDCLDKLVGYRGSPLVWRLNNGAKSVGRVQSASLHLVCKREREILAFVPQDYWSVFVDYAEGFRAFFHGGSTVESAEHSGTFSTEAESEGIDDAGREETIAESAKVLSQEEAERLVQIARSHPHQIAQVEGKISPKKPPAPFTTSSLQQAAGTRLKFSPEQTMQIAQKLYEAGLITYMRTDSVQLSPDFCTGARDWLQSHDPDNVPEKTAKHRSSKDAQEAHEAIRPTDCNKSLDELKQELAEDEFKLYAMIWKRSIASQCKPAQLRKTSILIQSGPVRWQAKGQIVEFAGYSKYWKDLSADTELPVLRQEQSLELDSANHEQKQTQPPARYTEPKLVQIMERKGIGRPSTYAPTIATLKQREYVHLEKGKVQPTKLGLEVDEFLGQVLPELLESEFTAQMESTLDNIAKGRQAWESYLIGWNQDYFVPALEKAQRSLPEGSQKGEQKSFQRALEKSRVKCPSCDSPLSKMPSKKLTKKYFLLCETCRDGDEKNLVMFWSDRDGKWQQPKKKPESSGKVTEHSCPVCNKALTEISYQKNGQPKSMLKCSDPKSEHDEKHKNVVYFRSSESWWSPEYGNL